jgi:hypothetical protein
MAFEEQGKPWVGAKDAVVEIRDYSLWIKHIKGDKQLAAALEALKAGDTVRLSIDGYMGVWQKKEDGSNGLPTQGLKPLGEMRERWFRWFKERRREMVKITLDEEISSRVAQRRPASARVPLEWYGTKAEREAAWAALQADMNSGWRSDGPYGPRDELYER